LQNHTKNKNWREFQSALRLESKRRKTLPRLFKLMLLVLLCAGCMLSINTAKTHSLPEIMVKVKKPAPLDDIPFNFIPLDAMAQKIKNLPGKAMGNGLTRQDLKALLDPSLLFNTETATIVVDRETDQLTITTTLDLSLQRFILNELKQLKTLNRGKPQRIGLVAMEPFTGKIVAMAGFDLDDPKANPCTMGNYPAASVFKIVTAAAAVESMGYTPDTPLYFNGGKYTLYKRQLEDAENRHSTQVTLARAFAESINPIFGKIASAELNPERLNLYATAFGFNQGMDSDFPFESGRILLTGTPYQLAEVGCGFNKTTTISPMFGAMLSSTIVNHGNIPMPSMVESVTNKKGSLLYTNSSNPFRKAVDPKTAEAIMTMMRNTIIAGTARKSFKGFDNDSTLSKLDMGGKTGSLFNTDNTIKYDWFTGFAKEKNGDKALALAIVVGHKKYIGTKAAVYGKMMFKNYFNSYFASNKTTINKIPINKS